MHGCIAGGKEEQRSTCPYRPIKRAATWKTSVPFTYQRTRLLSACHEPAVTFLTVTFTLRSVTTTLKKLIHDRCADSQPPYDDGGRYRHQRQDEGRTNVWHVDPPGIMVLFYQPITFHNLQIFRGAIDST